jgi:hypothetical protein
MRVPRRCNAVPHDRWHGHGGRELIVAISARQSTSRVEGPRGFATWEEEWRFFT